MQWCCGAFAGLNFQGDWLTKPVCGGCQQDAERLCSATLAADDQAKILLMDGYLQGTVMVIRDDLRPYIAWMSDDETDDLKHTGSDFIDNDFAWHAGPSLCAEWVLAEW